MEEKYVHQSGDMVYYLRLSILVVVIASNQRQFGHVILYISFLDFFYALLLFVASEALF